MNRHLQIAHNIGAQLAKEHFHKLAERGDFAVPIAGAMGTIPAALTGGLTSPEGQGFAGAAGAGAGSLLGQTAGGIGGATLGGLTGYGAARLYNAFQKDPSLWEKLIGKDPRIDPGLATSVGALLGSGIGALGGGALGARYGHRSALGRSGGETPPTSQPAQDTYENAGEENALPLSPEVLSWLQQQSY